MTKKDAILENYKNLLAEIDQKTAAVYASSPEIPCKNKCFDCCKQLFPVSFAEAYYISEGYKTLPRSTRREREKAAQKIQKKILAKDPFQFEKKAVEKKSALQTHSEFAKFLHSIESDCPALDPSNPEGSCTVYEFRNHDCRTMGASFDSSVNTIVGCDRFINLQFIQPKLMDYYYKYPEKNKMDRELIAELTGNTFTPNIIYFTTMCSPLLKDFGSENWIKFFEEKGVPLRANEKSQPASESALESSYFVVIDV